MNRDPNFLQALCVVYGTMIASTPLLEFAIPRCDGVLRHYYERHLEEERGHERMLADDLRRLGVESIPRFFWSAQAAGSQYYLIAHAHPACLLGYMKAMERAPLSVNEVDRLAGIHGTALKALRHHAVHDPMHQRDLAAVIDQLPPNLKRLVDWNEAHILRMMDEGVREEPFHG